MAILLAHAIAYAAARPKRLQAHVAVIGAAAAAHGGEEGVTETAKGRCSCFLGEAESALHAFIQAHTAACQQARSCGANK